MADKQTLLSEHTEVRLDLHVYPLLAIQKAASALSPCCVTQIIQDDEDTVTLNLRARLDAPPIPDPHAVFMSLLNDLVLQDRIADQTKEIRLALIRAALFEALPPSN
jgi:His-Xaa-Ser system protein HxsD